MVSEGEGRERVTCSQATANEIYPLRPTARWDNARYRKWGGPTRCGHRILLQHGFRMAKKGKTACHSICHYENLFLLLL